MSNEIAKFNDAALALNNAANAFAANSSINIETNTISKENFAVSKEHFAVSKENYAATMTILDFMSKAASRWHVDDQQVFQLRKTMQERMSYLARAKGFSLNKGGNKRKMFARMWSKFNDYFALEKYDHLPASRFEEALSYLRNTISVNMEDMEK